MNKSERGFTLPIGRQGFPHFPGGPLRDCNSSEEPIQIALVADDQITAAQALGRLPTVWGGTVIVWRCNNDEARRHERSGQFDGIVYCETGEGETRTLRYSVIRRAGLWRGLDGGSV